MYVNYRSIFTVSVLSSYLRKIYHANKELLLYNEIGLSFHRYLTNYPCLNYMVISEQSDFNVV